MNDSYNEISDVTDRIVICINARDVATDDYYRRTYNMSHQEIMGHLKQLKEQIRSKWRDIRGKMGTPTQVTITWFNNPGRGFYMEGTRMTDDCDGAEGCSISKKYMKYKMKYMKLKSLLD